MDLTAQEFRIALKISQGYLEKEIADQLCISETTVHTHAYNIRKRNGLRNAVDITREFILSLDNPKKYFAALICLFVQLFIIVEDYQMDLRKPTTQIVSNRSRSSIYSRKDYWL